MDADGRRWGGEEEFPDTITACPSACSGRRSRAVLENCDDELAKCHSVQLASRAGSNRLLAGVFIEVSA